MKHTRFIVPFGAFNQPAMRKTILLVMLWVIYLGIDATTRPYQRSSSTF